VRPLKDTRINTVDMIGLNTIAPRSNLPCWRGIRMVADVRNGSKADIGLRRLQRRWPYPACDWDALGLE
jgi:hypothetical protein